MTTTVIIGLRERGYVYGKLLFQNKIKYIVSLFARQDNCSDDA